MKVYDSNYGEQGSKEIISFDGHVRAYVFPKDIAKDVKEGGGDWNGPVLCIELQGLNGGSYPADEVREYAKVLNKAADIAEDMIKKELFIKKL